jgi:hypothetical protein
MLAQRAQICARPSVQITVVLLVGVVSCCVFCVVSALISSLAVFGGKWEELIPHPSHLLLLVYCWRGVVSVDLLRRDAAVAFSFVVPLYPCDGDPLLSMTMTGIFCCC